VDAGTLDPCGIDAKRRFRFDRAERLGRHAGGLVGDDIEVLDAVGREFNVRARRGLVHPPVCAFPAASTANSAERPSASETSTVSTAWTFMLIGSLLARSGKH
jgi:hypothetical protein